MKKDRKIAQYVDEIVDYDSTLFYTLTPGNHPFNNCEFETTIEVSTKEFRDHPGSKNLPEVDFSGDTYSIEWAVTNDEN